MEKKMLLENGVDVSPKFYWDDEEEDKAIYYDSHKSLPTNSLKDNVNHPAHYTFGKYEVIDIIKDQLSEEQFKGYCLGNAIKYICRCQHKGKFKEDLKKSIWYLNKIIEEGE